jgi:transposase-like protein
MSERELYWRGVLERQARSGESVVDFCGAEGISTASFYSWRKRLRVERNGRRSDVGDHRPQLVSVSVSALPACVEVVLPDGVVLRVPEGVAPQTLRDVLAALEPGPC